MEEVHLWLGTAEQRALRFASRKAGQFAYFDQQLHHPDWQDKKVLDFGGNAGNLLRDPNCTIRPENYYCIDILKDALEEGQRRFPQAHWHYYNRYNCSFNPEGLVDANIPDMGIKFDAVLAYSVFTHTTLEEMHDLIAQLRAQLAPGGTLAFTFIDPHYRSWPDTDRGNNLQWRLDRIHKTNPSLDVNGLLEQSHGAKWCTLVDGSDLYVNSNGTWRNETQTCLTYHVYYTAKFLRREFPGTTIRPPLNGEMQHCCLMQREA